MSILDQVEKPVDAPVIGTICGDSGVGKTLLAATFPNPIFIRAEDGIQSIPASVRPDALPEVESSKQLWGQLTALCNEEHNYGTLVLDSVTALERMFEHEVVEGDPKAKAINTALGGYGAGRSAVAAMHSRIRKAAKILRDKRGMHVVFIAHADVETMKLPDKDDYMRYTLRLHEKSMPYYVDDVDLVGFIRLTSHTLGEDGERKRAISTGQRELIAFATAENVSKNRFGISDALDIPFDEEAGMISENPLMNIIPSLKPATKKPAAKPQQKKDAA